MIGEIKMSLIEQIKNGELDEVELLEYVTDNDINVAIAVAESSMATEPILDIAANDIDRRVRLAAVMNPNIGKQTLIRLTKDTDIEIATIAYQCLDRG